MVQQLNFVGLVVKDVEQATEFYTKKLGLKAVTEESVPGEFTIFGTEGAMLAVMNGISDLPGDKATFEAGLQVADTDKTYAEWKANGVDVIGEPHDMPFGRTFLFRTPDGHVLRAWTPAARN